MDLGFSGKTCLVTGASTGIGRATALMLAGEGARVIAAARNRDALASLAVEIEEAGGYPAVILTADLTAPDGPRTLASEALAACPRIEVLINNAGGSRPLAKPDDEAAWEEAFLLNFTAARQITDRLVPGMLQRGWGRIVNVSGAIIAKAYNAATPANAALESWSKASAATYASRGVTVNCVAPGRINTPQILNRLHPTEEARRAFIDANIPAGRFGEPHEAAALIAFLASAPASFITGTTIPVDGGALRLAF